MNLDSIRNAVNEGRLITKIKRDSPNMGVRDGHQHNMCRILHHDILNQEGEQLYGVVQYIAYNGDYKSHEIFDYKRGYYLA